MYFRSDSVHQFTDAVEKLEKKIHRDARLMVVMVASRGTKTHVGPTQPINRIHRAYSGITGPTNKVFHRILTRRSQFKLNVNGQERQIRNQNLDEIYNQTRGKAMNTLEKVHIKVIRVLGITMCAMILSSNSLLLAAVEPVHTESHAQPANVKRVNRTGTNPGPSHETPEVKSGDWKPANGVKLQDSVLMGSEASPQTVDSKEASTKSETNKNTKEATAKEDDEHYTPEQQKECSTVVKDNFHKWITEAGGTGDTLTLPEIGILLRDDNLPPKQAAAVAALAHYFYSLEGEHDTNPVSGLTLKQIEHAIEHPDKNGSSTHVAFAKQLIANFHTAYENVREDTHKDGAWSLWGDHDPPILSENVQWKLNDCYVISTINAMIKNHPGDLKNMIKEIPPNTFIVNFPGYDKPIEIKLTPGEVAEFSYSRHGGCYLAVLGMAVVHVMKATGTDHNKAAAQTPLGALVDTHTFGWVQKNVMHLFTGHDFKQITIGNYGEPQQKAFIETALRNHELIGIDYGQDQHFLTIIGLKDVDGKLMVEIKNPWGTLRPFEGHSGPDGVFTVPLSDLGPTATGKSGFDSITIRKSDYDHVMGHADSGAPPDAPAAESRDASAAPVSASEGSTTTAQSKE